MATPMESVIPPGEQLVVELYVRNLKESLRFYQQWGFTILREHPPFAELVWEHSHLMLLEQPRLERTPDVPVGNIQVLVPKVDDYWELAQRPGATIVRPVGGRPYGLRDFTVASPDGLELRFATRITP